MARKGERVTTPRLDEAVVLSGSQEGPPRGIKIVPTKNPIGKATLGDLGLAVTVRAEEAFPTTILRLPLKRQAVEGIEPASVRLFRWREKTETLHPVWRSGYVPEYEYAWAKTELPGTYVALGLPRDPFLRELLRGLAARRRALGLDDPGEEDQLTREFLTPLLDASEKEIYVARAEFARIEVHNYDPRAMAEMRLGPDGAVAPFPMPGDMGIPDLRRRIKGLRPRPGGLPEEQLFYPPDDPFPYPWPRPRPEPEWFWPWPWYYRWWRIEEILERILCILFGGRNWWMYHRDEHHSGRAGCSSLSSTNVGSLVPHPPVALDGSLVCIPVIVDGKCYVGTAYSNQSNRGGTVYRIDLATRAIEAQFGIPSGVGARQGQTGVGSSVAVVDGRVYVSAMTGKVYCLDAGNLAQVWVTDLRHTDLPQNQPVDHGTKKANGWSSPLVVNGKVYVGCGEGEDETPPAPNATFGFVYCLDAANGRIIWLTCTNQFNAAQHNQPNVIPPSSFAGTPPSPYVKAPADPARGSSPWSSLAYDSVNNAVSVGTGNAKPDDPLPDPGYASGMLCLDADTGAVRWFFQPAPADSYRPDEDDDVDVPGSPLIFDRAGTRILGFGSKNGSYFLLDPATGTVLARRQLLPYDSAGNPLPNVDPGVGYQHENMYGVFGVAAVDPSRGVLFVGLGGYGGHDSATTPFIRALDWNTLADAWPTSGTNPPKYSSAQPPLYTTPNEAGLSSPASVNDVVFVSTTKPGLYALDADTGLCLKSLSVGTGWCLGPAIYGNYVVAASDRLYIFSR